MITTRLDFKFKFGKLRCLMELLLFGSLRKEVDLPDVRLFIGCDRHLPTSLKRDGQHRNPNGHLVETLTMNLSRQDRRKTEALEQTLLDLTGEVDNYK